MLELILLFFPTFVSLVIEKKRKNIDYKELLFLYPVYNIVINVFTFMIYFLVKGRELILFSQNVDSVGFSYRFLVVASVISICIPYLKEFILKNFLVEIEIRRSKNKNVK